jgi:hypothetical protein
VVRRHQRPSHLPCAIIDLGNSWFRASASAFSNSSYISSYLAAPTRVYPHRSHILHLPAQSQDPALLPRVRHLTVHALAAGMPHLPDPARAPYNNPTYPSKARLSYNKPSSHNNSIPTPSTQATNESGCSPPPSSSTSTANLVPSAALLPAATPRPADLVAA